MLHDPKIPARKRPGALVVHPFLLAVFPILSLLAHNRHEVELGWAVTPLLVAWCLAVVVWGMFTLLLRDRVKGAIPASLCLLLLFSYGHLVGPFAIDSQRRAEALVFLLTGFVFLLGTCAVLYRLQRPRRLTQFVNVAAAVAVAMPILSLAWHELGGEAGSSWAAPVLLGQAEKRPDIYVIIPDAHARADVLRDTYNYDVEPFFGELESLGFAVARDSTANYSMTPVSIASMLNFRYLAELPELAWGDLGPFTDLIRESAVESLLVEQGYKTVAFPSAAAYTEMRHFDQYHQGLGAAVGFYRMVADLTPLTALLKDHPGWNGLLNDRERILHTLQDLPAVAHDPDPTFTFVHLSLPHPPFQFGENGEDVFAQFRGVTDDGVGSRSVEAQDQYPEAYRAQTIFTNRRLLDVVKQILAKSDNPPIIMIVSDHGPRLNFHWRDARMTDPREALGNLTAVYLPDNRAAELIYPTITPVNVMRIVLNEALGSNLPLLEDRAFLSTNVDEIHRLADVTGAIRQIDRLSEAAQNGGLRARRAEREPEPAPMQQDNWLAPLDQTPLLR